MSWKSGCLGAALLGLMGCTSTVDSLGYDEGGSGAKRLLPITGPDAYPNAFRDVLGKTQAEIDAKLEAAFQQLFHGNADTQAIYFPVGTDQALIRDILHDDVRSEGIGYGMLVAVELDHRDELDALWRYAKSTLEFKSGPNRGYFSSQCDSADSGTVACVDPFGMEQMTMALVFAHGRWKSTGAVDYEAAALELFDVMLHKEEQNGDAGGDVTNLFDPHTELVYDEPKVSAASITRPAAEIPAYYALWAQATGDAFFDQAAQSGRAYLAAVSNPVTGLMPVRARFDGTPVLGWDSFRHEGYRAHLNLALDEIWLGDAWNVEEADRLIQFFSSQGIDTYGRSFALDGTVLDPARENALIVMNGALSLVSTLPQRTEFIQAVWDLELPTGSVRYYAGMLDLLALVVLSGKFQVY